MTRGRRGSLALRRRALPSPPPCRFIPALSKTEKHDYPSAAWRRSYSRRTGAERGFATTKDPATNDISRGWCRLMGLAPLMLFTTTLLIVRNQRILHAWNARQEETARRAAARPAPENPPPAPQDPHRLAATGPP